MGQKITFSLSLSVRES